MDVLAATDRAALIPSPAAAPSAVRLKRDTPPYRRESVSFAAGDGLFGRHGSHGVDSKPSRRAVRRTVASSGEWPAATDARPESLELFVGHHGIDPLDSSGRPGEDARLRDRDECGKIAAHSGRSMRQLPRFIT
jgi:hypothetical protein